MENGPVVKEIQFFFSIFNVSRSKWAISPFFCDVKCWCLLFFLCFPPTQVRNLYFPLSNKAHLTHYFPIFPHTLSRRPHSTPSLSLPSSSISAHVLLLSHSAPGARARFCWIRRILRRGWQCPLVCTPTRVRPQVATSTPGSAARDDLWGFTLVTKIGCLCEPWVYIPPSCFFLVGGGGDVKFMLPQHFTPSKLPNYRSNTPSSQPPPVT